MLTCYNPKSLLDANIVSFFHETIIRKTITPVNITQASFIRFRHALVTGSRESRSPWLVEALDK